MGGALPGISHRTPLQGREGFDSKAFARVTRFEGLGKPLLLP